MEKYKIPFSPFYCVIFNMNLMWTSLDYYLLNVLFCWIGNNLIPDQIKIIDHLYIILWNIKQSNNVRLGYTALHVFAVNDDISSQNTV